MFEYAHSSYVICGKYLVNSQLSLTSKTMKRSRFCQSTFLSCMLQGRGSLFWKYIILSTAMDSRDVSLWKILYNHSVPIIQKLWKTPLFKSTKDRSFFAHISMYHNCKRVSAFFSGLSASGEESEQFNPPSPLQS
jgi:hypothetical protein